MCIHWVHFFVVKDAGLRIRVQRELREQFLEACRAEDKPAAQVLREFMREYVAKHQASLDSAELSSNEVRAKTVKGTI
ncbi:MAG: hypothetical protein AB2766_02795 [Candidatus Thiodiazotropha endolucinida]